MVLFRSYSSYLKCQRIVSCDAGFQVKSSSKNLGILNNTEAMTVDKIYFKSFLRRRLALLRSCRCIIGLETAAYLSCAIHTIINIDAVSDIALNGWIKYGNNMVLRYSLYHVLWLRTFSTWKSKKVLSITKRLINKVLKKWRNDLLTAKTYIAIKFISIPPIATQSKAMSIQNLNISKM